MKKLLMLLLVFTAIKAIAQLENPADKDKKAKLDKTFTEGSKIKLNNLTSTQTANLVTLGKLWGLLKYHHPTIAKGEYNWDFELFRIIPKVLDAKTNDDRNEVFLNWISSLGTFKTIEPKTAIGNVKYKPNFDWFHKSGFSKKLINQLNLIKKADRTTEGYYVKLYDAETPIAIFKNEDAYASFKYPDDGYRLLALFRFWNIYEYFSPYKNVIDKPWGNVLEEYVPKFLLAKDELTYKLTAAAFVGETKDSHSDISPYDRAFIDFYGKFKPNIEIVFIDNLPVVKYSNDEVAGINTLKKGDIIQSINQVSVSQLVKEKLLYFTASNLPTQYRKLAIQFLRTNDTLMRVTYSRNGKSENTTLKCFPYNRMNYRMPMPADSGFKMINNIAYFNVGRIKTKLKSVISQALMAKAIIIDMRSYPNPTSFAWDMGKYLFQKPMDVAKYTQGSVETPGLFTYMSDEYMANVKIGDNKNAPYSGKVIVLVNEETQSLAELSTMALSARPNTIIVGSQTAGADGTVGMPVTFPGGISTGFTQIGVYYPSGKETQRVGIVPDFKVKLTVNGIKEGKDEILEKAISLVP